MSLKMSASAKKKGLGTSSTLKDVHSWYMGFTSIGGLSQYASNDLTVSKVFWLILFLVGMALTLMNFIQVLIDIALNKVTTTTTLEQQASLPFPGVTICNQNRVHCGNLYDMISACEAELTCTRKDVFCEIYKIGGCEVSVKVSSFFLQGITPAEVCSNYFFNLTYQK